MNNVFNVVFPLYPGVTQLDFTGPLEVFWKVPEMHCELATTTGGELAIGPGFTLNALTKLSAIKSCSLLCVPGGPGVTAALEDPVYLSELRRLAQGARWITSVCTGSLLLGAAGLLKQRRAGCHWSNRDELSLFGATPCADRVVVDGDRITGGGVTAGIDFALTVVAQVFSVARAQGIQLALEYAPKPPFDSGTPETAAPQVLGAVRAAMARAQGDRPGALRRAAQRAWPDE